MLIGLWFMVEIGHDERLRLTCNVAICMERERKNKKYFINSQESSITCLLPAGDAQ